MSNVRRTKRREVSQSLAVTQIQLLEPRARMQGINELNLVAVGEAQRTKRRQGREGSQV